MIISFYNPLFMYTKWYMAISSNRCHCCRNDEEKLFIQAENTLAREKKVKSYLISLREEGEKLSQFKR